MLARWRSAGIPAVANAPLDGRTETAPAAHVDSTRAQLGLLLGAPSVEVADVDAPVAAAA